MAGNTLITDELKKLIGIPMDPSIFKVEEGAIRRYAEAIGDPNPLYNDVDYASKSKYGRLVCPPGFTGWPVKGKLPVFRTVEAISKAGAPPRVLDGDIEFEFFVPICAGDILVAICKIADMVEKETKRGKMIFTSLETTFVNQNGDVAIRSRATYIYS